MNLRIASMLLFSLLMVWSACKDDDDDPTPDEMTLYEKLGGDDMVADPNDPNEMIEEGRLAIRSVVDSSIFVIAANPDLAVYFQALIADITGGDFSTFFALSENFTDYIAVEAGAENFTYDGMNMSDAHDPTVNSRMAMTADNDDFNSFIAAIVTGANQNSVPSDLIGELGEILEATRSDIVQ